MTRKVVAVALVQAIVLTWLANVLPTWQDEEFTLATTAHGIAYAIHRALTYELQAPLYFALLGALRTLDASVLFARELSVAAQVGTTLACGAFARRLWPGRDPWVFCALVASNPFAVFAAMEIRTYSLSLLESALLFVAFLEGFYVRSDVRARIAFVVCAILGMYTQYFIAFEMAAFFIALAVTGRFRALAWYVACCAATIAAFVPLGMYVRGQASDTLSVEDSRVGGFGGMLLHPVNLLVTHDFPGGDGRWQKLLWAILRIGIVLLVVAGAPKPNRKQAGMIAVFVVVDLIYVVLNDVLKLNLIYPRHYVALFLPEAILVYVLVSSFRSRFASRYAIATATLFAIGNVVSFEQTYAAGAKLGDSRRVGTFLSANARPGDAIAAYPGDDVPPLRRYYDGALPIEGFPLPQNPVTYDVDAALVRSPAEANAAFDRLPHARHLWFVMDGDCGDSNIHGCDTTQTVMNARFNVLQRRAFYEATVFELEPKRS